MFKLGSILLFVTLTQFIAVIMSMLFFLGSSFEIFNHIPPLVLVIILFELVFSLILMWLGEDKPNL